MAKLEYAKDVSLTVNSNGISRVREKLIEAESIEELIASKMIPEYGSRHPENSRFRLSDGSIDQVGNAGGKLQFKFSGTYVTNLSKSSGGGDDDRDPDIDPWELGAQDFTKDRFTVSRAIFNLRRKDGTLVPFVNSANCRLEGERDVYGTEYTFLFCLKYRDGISPRLPGQPVVNSSTVRVAGEDLPAYSSLLFPPQMRLVTDRNDAGEIKRSYWEISCKIRRHPDPVNGWFESYPDIGTLALGADGRPAPIYRFIPWTSDDEDAKLATLPAYGTIQQVIYAKNRYARATAGAVTDRNEKYWQAWQELPYEEVTEPLPLNNGKVYLEAMANPLTHPYRQIVGTVYQLGKFQQYNLPEKREG